MIIAFSCLLFAPKKIGDGMSLSYAKLMVAKLKKIQMVCQFQKISYVEWMILSLTPCVSKQPNFGGLFAFYNMLFVLVNYKQEGAC